MTYARSEKRNNGRISRDLDIFNPVYAGYHLDFPYWHRCSVDTTISQYRRTVGAPKRSPRVRFHYLPVKARIKTSSMRIYSKRHARYPPHHTKFAEVKMWE
jgi:hypothetical protein